MSPGTPWNSQIVESLLTQKKIHWSHLKPRNAQVVAHSWKNKACGKNRVQLVNTCSGHLWSLEYPKTASPMFSYTVAYISYCFHISTRLLVWQIFSLRMHWVMSHTSVPTSVLLSLRGPFCGLQQGGSNHVIGRLLVPWKNNRNDRKWTALQRTQDTQSWLDLFEIGVQKWVSANSLTKIGSVSILCHFQPVRLPLQRWQHGLRCFGRPTCWGLPGSIPRLRTNGRQ